MFALIESGPAPRHAADWPSRAASFALHAALTTAAVLATRGGAATTHYTPFIDPGLVWQAPPPQPSPASAPGSITPQMAIPVPNLLVAPLTAPIDIPPPDSTSGWTPLPGSDPLPGPGPGSTTLPGSPSGTGVAPIDARWAEEPPILVSHPATRYPEVLRQALIEGRVTIEAVIDTLGRAEPGSLRVVSSAHALFDREAMAVVLGSQYRPGRVNGRPVRVRVQVPVSFAIRR